MSFTFQFSERVKRLDASPIHSGSARARELAAQGREVVNFVVGAPEFNLPAHLEAKADEAMKHALMEFGAVEGQPDMIEAVIAKFARENNLHFSPEQVIVCNGGKEVLSDAVQVLVNPGDEVILFAPYWPSYKQFILREGGTPVVIQPEGNDFRIRPAQLAAAITPRTKWFILNNPQNPCGVVYSQTELLAFAKVIAQTHVAVIADECFELFNYSGTPLVSFATLPDMGERTFTVNGIGKSYGKPGLRIGYGAGSRALIEKLRILQSSGPTHANMPGQAAATIMLGDVGQWHVPALCAMLKHNRDVFCNALAEIPGIRIHLPESSYFAFPDVTGLYGKKTPSGKVLRDSNDVREYWLEEGIAVLDGTYCGLPGHVRLAYTAPLEMLQKGSDMIRLACGKLI